MTAHTLKVRNANDGLCEGLRLLAKEGVHAESRNGPVLVAPGPVMTQYARPAEHVLFSPLRDANPFFHLYEAIWMLAGRNDSGSVAHYAKQMAAFAEPDGTLHGAYGHRWRHHFEYDQLLWAAKELHNNPSSRRVVVGMWDPYGDALAAVRGAKDVPCNTHIYFDVRSGALQMTVCNRSNDIVWGCYGANFVHMGMLHEVMAAELGVRVGVYTQMSNNFHAYVTRPDVTRLLQKRQDHGYNLLYSPDERYGAGVTTMPIRWSGEPFGLVEFLAACERAAEDHRMLDGGDGYFLNRVFKPMMTAHSWYKAGDYGHAHETLGYCAAEDWRVAAREWLLRREQNVAKNAA